MEDLFNLETSEGYKIYGVINTGTIKSDNLIIFVHGFTGNMNEHFLFNAALFFPTKGFDTARFNLYWYDDGRKFNNVSILDHIYDFDKIIKHFSKKYKNIYAVGHSLGAQIIIRSRYKSYKAVTLWEPSQEVVDMCNCLDFSVELNAYIEHSNVDIIVGRKFVDDAKTLTSTKDLLSNITYPMKIIGAELAGANIAEKLYYSNINSSKEIYILKNSGHTFDEIGVEKELFNQTLEWFKKYL